MPIVAQDAAGTGGDNHARNDQEIEAVRRYLDDLLQGAAFRGSPRSQQFLRYIIEKALSGEVESLRERTIGVQLFRRESTYDTGQDAIVRVAATEVRRRLVQHYGRHGDTSRIHISLPIGSYVPEIDVQPGAPAAEPFLTTAEPTEEPISSEERVVESTTPSRSVWVLWMAGAAGVVLGILLAMAFAPWRYKGDSVPISSLPPWTAMLRGGHSMQMITSDPNIEHLQELTGSNISVSDYAEHIYIPVERELAQGQREFYQYYEHADNAASLDTPLAVSIARIVPSDFPVRSRSARSLRITDFQTDDGLVLIGSPRSNPWVDLFADQLDFRFVYDPKVTQEIVVNPRPRTGEKTQYIPTARGFATGESYALIAMVHNQNQTGRVLLLAGVNGEGTEAAGHMVTDRVHLLRILQQCGIPTQGAVPDFEVLLQVRMLAGSPSVADILACHLLPGRTTE